MVSVNRLGWETPTQIQAQSIPSGIEGRDIIGASQTGTGKTAAFGLPILTRIEPKKQPQVLILEPTRELAAQVFEAFYEMGKFTHNRRVLLYGGVGYEEQLEDIENGGNIIIATPGRLLDHVQKGTLSLKTIEVLVLDETDRMLDMGFLPDVRKIAGMCPEGRQTMLFSATMPPQIEGLAKWALKDPLEIEIGQRRSIPKTVKHAFYPVSIDQRDDLLVELVRRTDFSSVMVFTRTKREADHLTEMVKRETKHSVVAMHSDIPQRKREDALRGFRAGEYDVIIATDLAARGLDISSVSHVINYRVPENAEDYVHRIGRTGRAEREGDAFTILSADELDFAKAVEIFVEAKIERRKLDNFDYVYTALLDDKPAGPVRVKRKGPKRRKRG
ncbi:MAG: ATP-dependent RNA helicase RhlE [Verrucomicrobiales bacterium]|jgi:ATP-dependent RNA helicase RhlE